MYDALAQHYGLETGWLDITSDFNVAMFFATCYWDSETEKWKPLTKEQTEDKEEHKYGMIYHMPSNQMAMRWTRELNKYYLYSTSKNHMNPGSFSVEKLKHPTYRGDISNLVMPIGFQPFMRCSMQNGYGIYMRKPVPLQNDPGFEKLRFRHNEDLSKKVFEMMKGGELIYPHEGLRLANFVIKDICKATIFSKEAFYEALYRNHYYKLENDKQCRVDLNEFKIDGQSIRIGNKHPWKLSAKRRRKIDSHYKKFSVEDYYGIKIMDRVQFPGMKIMFEPWMMPEDNDGEGVQDFEPRERVMCGTSISDRKFFNLMHMIKNGQIPDF